MHQGFPATTAPAGTSKSTTVPAPTTAPAPILAPSLQQHHVSPDPTSSPRITDSSSCGGGTIGSAPRRQGAAAKWSAITTSWARKA